MSAVRPLQVLHEARVLPKCAQGYKRTREHLISWSPALPPHIKEATLSISKLDQDASISPHSGTWLFLYENMPQLRYHNPSVKFNFMTHLDKDSFISFNRGGGNVFTLITSGLRQKEIQTKIEHSLEQL